MHQVKDGNGELYEEDSIDSIVDISTKGVDHWNACMFTLSGHQVTERACLRVGGAIKNKVHSFRWNTR